jgi:hypothetical protein
MGRKWDLGSVVQWYIVFGEQEKINKLTHRVQDSRFKTPMLTEASSRGAAVWVADGQALADSVMVLADGQAAHEVQDSEFKIPTFAVASSRGAAVLATDGQALADSVMVLADGQAFGAIPPDGQALWEGVSVTVLVTVPPDGQAFAGAVTIEVWVWVTVTVDADALTVTVDADALTVTVDTDDTVEVTVTGRHCDAVGMLFAAAAAGVVHGG